jgi:hypothetical protein
MNTGAQSKNTPFHNNGFGMIYEKMSKVTEKCKRMGKKYTVVKDFIANPEYGFLQNVFNSIYELNETIPNIPESRDELASNVLEFFYSIKQKIDVSNKAPITTQMSKYNMRDYRFSDVIFLDVKHYLSATMEYILLMYKNLLHLGFRLSEMYVVIDYRSDHFDFIDRAIFKFMAVSPRTNISEEMMNESGSIPKKTSLKQYPPFQMENFQMNTYLTGFPSFTTQIIVSENNLYKRILETELLGRRYNVFENLEMYQKEKTNEISIILLKSLEELEGKVLPECYILIDTRVKIQSNLHYGGNIPIPKRINNDYFYDRVGQIKELTRSNLKINFFFTKSEHEDRIVTRGIYERSPIIDYIKADLSNIDLKSLYEDYHDNHSAATFISLLKSDREVLKDIGYFENPSLFKFCPSLNLHPVMVAVINKWFELELPKLPILVFVAVTTMFDKKIIETKEHGEKEIGTDITVTTRYGQEMQSFLTCVTTYGSFVRPEGGRAAEKLKKLINAYKLDENDMKLFDINQFTRKLVYVISTYFPKMILKKKKYSSYRSSYNEQMNWWISETCNADKIWPITVFTEKLHKHVTLFIPIE